jgi:hypothetical protein
MVPDTFFPGDTCHAHRTRGGLIIGRPGSTLHEKPRIAGLFFGPPRRSQVHLLQNRNSESANLRVRVHYFQ